MKHLLKYSGIIFFLFFFKGALNASSFTHISTLKDNHKVFTINNYCNITDRFYTDSVPFAKVVIYRPGNQLKRPYHFKVNSADGFSLNKNETKKMDVFSKDVEINVRALGHKAEQFSFALSGQKTHYLRVQDRNNYAGTRPYLEIIEVTEATYKNDLN